MSRDRLSYEWTAELLDRNGDIEDSDFSEKLRDLDTEGRRVGLVRQRGNEHDGVTERTWAYVEGGKLPRCFQDGERVPVRFHAEWALIETDEIGIPL